MLNLVSVNSDGFKGVVQQDVHCLPIELYLKKPE